MFFKPVSINDMNVISNSCCMIIEFSSAAFKHHDMKPNKTYRTLKENGYLDWVCNPSRAKVIEYLRSHSIPWSPFSSEHSAIINKPYNGSLCIDIPMMNKQPLDKQHYKIKRIYCYLNPDNKGRCRIAGVKIQLLNLDCYSRERQSVSPSPPQLSKHNL